VWIWAVISMRWRQVKSVEESKEEEEGSMKKPGE